MLIQASKKTVLILLQMVKFKDFSRPLSVFQVLYQANFIFKDFSRQSCIFKYFQACANPVKDYYEIEMSVLKLKGTTGCYTVSHFS